MIHSVFKPEEEFVKMHSRFFLIVICLTFVMSNADSTDTVQRNVSADSTFNGETAKEETAGGNDETVQKSPQSRKLSRKERRRKGRERRRRYNIMSQSAHESMLVGSGNHKHGFTGRKVRRGNTPLKPQTFCPVMGGPVNKEYYADYKGVRVYFCCEGCIYRFKQTPNLFIKTLERYGENPEKIK